MSLHPTEARKATTEAPKADAKPEAKPDPMDQPQLSLDAMGNLVLFIPLRKTNEVFARGLIDMARSHTLKWYVDFAAQQRQIKSLSQKGALRSFADRIMGNKGQ